MKDSVPKAMTAHYQAVIAMTDAFCRQHLNEEYATLARRTVAALCRKRPSPISRDTQPHGHAGSCMPWVR
jgi:hypothetical protein